MLFSLIAIGLYITFRFKRWQWASGATAALAFNALLIIGIFSMFYGLLPFNLEVNQAFIAAILTIIGYAINDTVVVFDRIREYLGLYPKRNLKETVRENVETARENVETVKESVKESLKDNVHVHVIYPEDDLMNAVDGMNEEQLAALKERIAARERAGKTAEETEAKDEDEKDGSAE